jgi:two-component system, chemotaxis family, CheB/CheR fusion protein
MSDNIANEPFLAADHRRNSQKLPVVGIGASAGGLEAFKSFFAKMPPDAGMAYVLVPHLDPGHKSLMVEIIGRHTAMPVVQVEDRMKIEPNHIYIIPPDRNLVVENDELVTCEISKARGINLPVDVFFRSLAVGWKESAIGIILSGTMRDGAMGLKDIKEHGGWSLPRTRKPPSRTACPKAPSTRVWSISSCPSKRCPKPSLNSLPTLTSTARPGPRTRTN